VIQDYTLSGQSREIIDEFPFFSFLLADLHPHVLSMPFVLLLIYFGLSKFISDNNKEFEYSNFFLSIKTPQFWFAGLILGVLLFVNTWDFPIYFGFFVLIRIIQAVSEVGFNKKVIKDTIIYSLSLGIICVVLYSPFLLSLSSQAGGFLPSLIFRTRGIQFLIMFLPQLLLLSWMFLIINKDSFSLKKFSIIFIVGVLLSVLLFLLSIFYSLLPNFLAQIYNSIANITGIEMSLRIINIQNSTSNLLGIFGADSVNQLIQETIKRLFASPAVILFMILLITLCIIRLFQRENVESKNIDANKSYLPIQFTLILTAIGALLCFFPEFFYLRDQFGWRMNTIFKFYFQAWILFSLAAAYSITEICFRMKTVLEKVFSIMLIMIFLGTGLLYPFFSLPDKTNLFQNFNWSLDGNKYFQESNLLENEAISFLQNTPYGVIAEAIGGSYSEYGRISKFTGLPTILGWPGHESQWRGGANEIGNRESDIKELYLTSNWDYAKTILEKYKIRYIFLGLLEKNTYPVSERKFSDNLTKIFSNSEITIYEYSPKKL
jgi:YYY domain-containing protein